MPEPLLNISDIVILSLMSAGIYMTVKGVVGIISSGLVTNEDMYCDKHEFEIKEDKDEFGKTVYKHICSVCGFSKVHIPMARQAKKARV